MISGMSGMQSGVIERIEFLAPCLAFVGSRRKDIQLVWVEEILA